MSIAIIDYGSGNLRSAQKAFARISAAAAHPQEVRVVASADEVAAAERIVLPGVGAFADCMAGLAAIDGLCAALQLRVIEQGRPFLGICVGMQLMFARGLEDGETAGLGWLAGDVVALDVKPPLDAPPSAGTLKLPHIGWNTLTLPQTLSRPHPVFDGLDGADAYFVHSYAARPEDPNVICAYSEYGAPLVAGVAQNTICGTQFHPEKSQTIGMQLIANFLEWCP